MEQPNTLFKLVGVSIIAHIILMLALLHCKFNPLIIDNKIKAIIASDIGSYPQHRTQLIDTILDNDII